MKVNGFNPDNHNEELMSAALSSGRFPHAVIIEGGTLEARQSLAEKISRVLLCGEESGAPCEECSNCRKTRAGLHPDYLFYEPRKEKNSKNAYFSVDYIREIRDEAFIIPNEADRKVIVLSGAETMNVSAQNAFLKILEEPPEAVRFILLCPAKSVFIPTILSRVTVYQAGETADESINGIDFEKISETAQAVARAVASDNEFDIVKEAGAFDKDEKLFMAVLTVLPEIFSEALRIKYNAGAEENHFEVSPYIAGKLSRRTLLRLSEISAGLLEGLDMNANRNLTVTRLCSLFRLAVTEQE